MDKCKWFGHKWEVAFMKGKYNNIEVKFIGAFCKRCGKGENELHDTNNKMTEREYGTYSEKYFDK